MAANIKLKAIYNSFFDGTETWTANRISDFLETRNLKRNMPSERVPNELRQSVREYWKRFDKTISPKWAWFYARRNGIVDPRYIPHTLYYSVIDQHFNARKLGYGFNDKNYYSKIFSDVKQPHTIFRNVGGILLDEDYCLISKRDAVSKIIDSIEVVCKPSQESGSGRGISFWAPQKDLEIIKAFVNNPLNRDYIVQESINQHPTLSNINPSSVNTIRVCSLLRNNGVVILSACLRMGVGANRVDNHHAGGMSCGINHDGTLQKHAYYLNGERFESHPNGLVFEGFKIPSYEKVINIAKQYHSLIGNFKLVGWDIAVDQDGDAVLIECNMRKNGLELHQFSNGPLFGDLTDEILDEIFRH